MQMCQNLPPVFIFTLVIQSAASSYSSGSVVVELPGGSVRGSLTQGGVRQVAVWRGIPYAAPPVGDLRWRPPQPPKPWSPAVLSPMVSPGCMQIKQRNPTVSTGLEDCLYLNVFAPYPINNSVLAPVCGN